VSNFVETEVIVGREGDVSEDCQMLILRGSIPLGWKQPFTFGHEKGAKLVPQIIIEQDEEVNKTIYTRHIDLLSRLYPKTRVAMVSLVNFEEGSRECPISSLFEKLARNDTLITFNFHKEVPLKGWQQRLVDRITSKLPLNFASRPEEQPQTTLVRVNCLDSLDRTNSIQSQIAAHLYPAMLSKLSIHNSTTTTTTKFTAMMNSMWVVNADAISAHNTGSMALKTEVTRKGKQTGWGKFRDKLLTAQRYFNAFWVDDVKKEVMLAVYGSESL
jgi:hypothetical protein